VSLDLPALITLLKHHEKIRRQKDAETAVYLRTPAPARFTLQKRYQSAASKKRKHRATTPEESNGHLVALPQPPPPSRTNPPKKVKVTNEAQDQENVVAAYIRDSCVSALDRTRVLIANTARKGHNVAIEGNHKTGDHYYLFKVTSDAVRRLQHTETCETFLTKFEAGDLVLEGHFYEYQEPYGKRSRKYYLDHGKRGLINALWVRQVGFELEEVKEGVFQPTQALHEDLMLVTMDMDGDNA
jgi:hypothetical protein